MPDTLKETKIQMPVDSLSYSGMTQLLRNPLIYKLKFILGVYDGKIGVSGMIGKAGHETLKAYYAWEGLKTDWPVKARDDARDAGMKYLTSFSDSGIKYGKTGNREAMLKAYTKAMDVYFAEEPEYNELVIVEEKLTAELKTPNGELLPLPASGIPDLVHLRKDGKYEIIDAKFTKHFTKYEDEDGDPHEDYIKIIQAMFLIHLVKAAKGIDVERVLFREIKYTENKDGGPQIRDYVIPADHEPYRIIFYNLYKDVVKYLANNPIFLPNFSDVFDGEHAGLLYAQGLISSDMSDVEVMHKVRDVAFATKKFVASRLDRAENQDLLPEERVKMKLAEFGIPVEPVEVKRGASVDQYRFKVSSGVRMSTIKKHKDDIAKALAVKAEITILAPIPGTSLIGVEVAREDRIIVKLEKKHFKQDTLSLPIGVDVNGEVHYALLNELPHLLIAGATGSGKSFLLHAILTALIKQMKPKELGLVLFDPKRVELSKFAKAKHLLDKVVYEYEDGLRVLRGLVNLMEARYTRLEASECRDIAEFNTKNPQCKMQYTVLVADEYADFLLRSKSEEKKRNRKMKKLSLTPDRNPRNDNFNEEEGETDVELLIVRLAQMGRAAGIHLILSTQRPSVDVVTGLIKANCASRVALTTASPTDSIVILGQPGAEKLAGRGDMLFQTPGKPLTRLQGFSL